MLIRFDGHCPFNPQLKFRGCHVELRRLRADNADNDGWYAHFRGSDSSLWPTIPEAIQDAVSQYAGVQITLDHLVCDQGQHTR